MMKLKLTLKPLTFNLLTFFELFYIKNDFAKYFPKCYEIIINTKIFPYGWKYFDLICIKNDFTKQSAKCRNLFKYFLFHVTVVPRNDSFFYNRAN